MQDLNDKVNGGNLTAAEWNEVPSELQNIIEKLGITLSGADLDQVGKAVASMVASADYYNEAGVADAYVCNVSGSKQGLEQISTFTDGARVRFRPSNDNTGASTVDVNSLGAKSITREDGSALSPGDLSTVRDAEIRWNQANDRFHLMEFSLTSQANPVALRGYIDGFDISRDAIDLDHDVEIARGICRDDADTVTIQRTVAITKQIDAAWVEGDDVGGFPTALSLSPDTWYHLFVIRKTSDGNIDAGFDTSLTASNLLGDATGYAEFRRVASVLTDGASNVIAFRQRGDRFLWDTPPLDVNTSTLSTSSSLFTLSVPFGLSLVAHYNALVDQGSDNSRQVYIRQPGTTDQAPSNTVSPLSTINKSSPEIHPSRLETETDSSSRIAARSSGSSTILRIATLGWEDRRGRD